jgi:monothiol glutaredoxin
MNMNIQDTIRRQISESPVVLYMKGTPQFPQCGFSGATGADAQGLRRAALRRHQRAGGSGNPGRHQGVLQWPTIPQLYVKGELIGGADIVRELHESGELQTLLDSARAG